ncbi:hypothetical protein HRbin36_00172 [bacterium HR36]|nr:hypothetical protein HRbin36_00172 [bacterium HR36]
MRPGKITLAGMALLLWTAAVHAETVRLSIIGAV